MNDSTNDAMNDPVSGGPGGPGVASGPVRVVVVDDDPLVRAGLRMMLDGDGIAVVGEAGDGPEGCRQVAALHPDVVLMDIRMPGGDGLTATETILAGQDPPQVIVLTTFDADDHILRALRVGAAGFLLKDTPPTDIVQAIHRVAAGDAQLSPSVTRRLIAAAVGSRPRAEAAQARLAQLTPRELDVARAIGDGLSNAEIGARLYLSVPTVKAHVSAVLDKLAASNRVQVALLIHDAGTDGPDGPPPDSA